jgi:hypothetical protein
VPRNRVDQLIAGVRNEPSDSFFLSHGKYSGFLFFLSVTGSRAPWSGCLNNTPQ